MRIRKSIPWNWFKKEADSFPVAVQHRRSAIDGSPLAQLHTDLDRAFDDIFRGFGFASQLFDFPRLGGRSVSGFLEPTIDVVSEDQAHTINIEILGVDQDDVQVEVKDGILTISGEKKADVEEQEHDKLTHRECSYGNFQRTLSLPEDVDEDAIKANFKNGVLMLTLPRKELLTSNVRRISIDKDELCHDIGLFLLLYTVAGAGFLLKDLSGLR